MSTAVVTKSRVRIEASYDMTAVEKLKILTITMAKVLTGAELVKIEHADFDEIPCIEMIVIDPVMPRGVEGQVSIDIKPA